MLPWSALAVSTSSATKSMNPPPTRHRASTPRPPRTPTSTLAAIAPRLKPSNPPGADPLDLLDRHLARLDGDDTAAKLRTLGDLRELFFRHFIPESPDFSFHDPALEALPTRLEPGMIARIVARAGRALLGPAEPPEVRATAAFVLGKTADARALDCVARAVAAPTGLSVDAGRQCGFAFDTLWEACRPGNPPVDLDAVAAGFRALGVPWDDDARKVAVDDL